MMRISPNDSLLHGITIGNVTTYLELLGWVPVEHPNPKLFLFEGPNDDFGEPLELFVPKSIKYSDSYRRLADIVNVISVIEDRDVHDIITNLKYFDRDVFKIRVLDTGTSRSSLPLHLVYQQIGGLNNLLSYAACSEKKPQPYFKNKLDIGKKHSEKCQFGHTFDGSFGFTIESPLISSYVQSRQFGGEDPSPPFERRVIERIIRGFLAIKEALLKRDLNVLVELYSTAFNANMCEAIVKMSNKKSIRLEYTISWSPKIKPSKDVQNFSSILLENEAFTYLEKAAEHLKYVEPQEIAITGKVIQLSTEADPFDYSSLPRTILIKSYDQPGKPAKIKVSLSRRDYEVAIEAHKNGLPVSVRGILERKGNGSVLLEPRAFRLIQMIPNAHSTER